MNFDIDHIEQEAMESAEILFDYPEVAMEWGRGADPTKTLSVATPFLKRPFVESYMPEMKKTYSGLVKKLVPIALDVARNEQGIARVERIDVNKIIEMLEDTDFNYLATKLPDADVHTTHGYGYDANGKMTTTTNYDVTYFREYVHIRKTKGDAVLSVDIANVYYQNRFFNKTTEINRRMSDAFNSATKNQYVGKVFLTAHSAGGSDDGRSQDKTALQLNFIIDSKYRK